MSPVPTPALVFRNTKAALFDLTDGKALRKIRVTFEEFGYFCSHRGNVKIVVLVQLQNIEKLSIDYGLVVETILDFHPSRDILQKFHPSRDILQKFSKVSSLVIFYIHIVGSKLFENVLGDLRGDDVLSLFPHLS